MPPPIPAPSVCKTAFPCPNCGAYARQRWADCYGKHLDKVPLFPDMATVEKKISAYKGADPDEIKRNAYLKEFAEKTFSGQPFIFRSDAGYMDFRLGNGFISWCFNCEIPSIWIHDRLVYPPVMSGEPPNPDLPEDILIDYEEARSILDLSPRGAAALLRLVVQKLCVHLGEAGKDIDADIANLVSKGLDQMTAEALDSVRVVGNQAVHPGQMDLRDDRGTASDLFYAVNFIVEQLITKKKKIAEMYAKLPPAKREAIDSRNSKAIQRRATREGS